MLQHTYCFPNVFLQFLFNHRQREFDIPAEAGKGGITSGIAINVIVMFCEKRNVHLFGKLLTLILNLILNLIFAVILSIIIYILNESINIICIPVRTKFTQH